MSAGPLSVAAPPRPRRLELAPVGSLRATVLEELRIVVLVGIGLGVLVGGIGGRLAMLVLRLTSPDTVRGVISDDGFEIGRTTLGGTYNLLLVGAGLGVIGALAYRFVSPWLIGPTWFRNLTVALGSGAVVGSLLLHADGVDFTLLHPVGLAIALFVAVPMVFGALVGPATAAAERPGGWANTGRRRWALPLAALALFPATLILLVSLAVVVVVAVVLGQTGLPARLAEQAWTGVVVRALWLGVALLGLAALVVDIGDLAAQP